MHGQWEGIVLFVCLIVFMTLLLKRFVPGDLPRGCNNTAAVIGGEKRRVTNLKLLEIKEVKASCLRVLREHSA